MARVVVVGGGLAGLSAACELLERGCCVTIIEKEAHLGGNSSKATTGIAAPGSALQVAAGVKDDGAELASLDGEFSRDFVKKGTTDLEWLTKKLGVDDEFVLRLTPGHKQARTVGTKTHFPGAVVTYAAIHVLQQVASVKPDRLDIIYPARVSKLINEGGKVKGVEYIREGETTPAVVSGHVILATGGYCGDYSSGSILAQHAKEYLKYPTTNDERASGDALTLGRAVNAGTAALGQVQLTPMGAVIPGQTDSQFKIVISDALSGAGAKLIDKAGNRFCDECSSGQERVDAMVKNAAGPYRLVITEAQAEKCKWLVNFYAEREIMQKYSCAGALASEMRVPRLDTAIPATGKLFVATVTPSLYTCTGGLTIGSQGNAGKVLNEANKPIEGLYAAGEATAKGFKKLWSVSGIPMLWAVHSGRTAGTTVANIVQPGAKQQDLRDIIISSITNPTKVAEAAKAAADEKKDERPVESLSKEELIAKVKELMAGGGGIAAAAAPIADSGISMDEVKKHNKKDDAWIIVNGSVIDVTKWIPLHPGGEQVIEAFMGQDASEEWNAIHKPGTIEKNLVEKGGKGPWLIGKLGGGAAPAAAGGGGDGGLTLADVGKHVTEQDCWVVVNGKAYDVTKWLQVHPGGVQAITAYAGKDASDEWNCIHKPGTIEKNLYPGNANGPVDKGPVSGVAAAAPTGPVDDEEPAPAGNGGIPGPLGAVFFIGKTIVLMLLRTVFLTGNFKIDNDRKGTIRSACFLLTFTIIHVAGNFVGMLKGPMETNGEGYFFDRLAWTGGFGLWKEGPAGMSVVELYLAFALLLHVAVALQRSWEISMNYILSSGRWNMMLSGLTVLTFLTVHLADLRFSSHILYTTLRAPVNFVAFDGLAEGRIFFETDPSVPLVRARDLYTREVELFKNLPHALFYTVCIVIFWYHMIRGWQKLVPADAMQIPKDHVNTVTWLGWLAATAIVSMYLSVVWFTYYAPAQTVEHVP